MIGLHFDLSFYLFPLFILIGFGLSFFLYKKELKKKLLVKSTLRFIFVLRWITLSLIFFLILGPKLFKSENVAEKPILIFAQDNSESIIANKDSLYFVNSYKDSVILWMNELSKIYDVRVFTFGDKIEEKDQFNFNAKSTNLETLFENLENQFYSSNFTDLIIASDGIFNLGKSPRHLSFSKNINSHAVILGDTLIYPDIVIKTIKHNKYTLLQNKFPIEIVINSNSDAENVQILLYKDGQLVEQQKVEKLAKGINKFIFIETAIKKGICNYKVEVKSSLFENNLTNNTKSSLIEIIDYSQKILVLSSAPHPDIAAISSVLKDLPKSKNASFLINEFDEKLSGYDLIIFHKPFKNKLLLKKLQIANEKGIPALIITGQNLDLISSSFSLVGMKKNKFKGSTKSSAGINNDFNLFNINKEWNNAIDQYPPLNTPFSTDFRLNDNSKVLFYQSINNIKMPYPLIYFFESLNNVKYCTIIGEGIWRWKMSEYQNFNNDNSFKSIFKKIIQVLKKVDKKERLKVKVASINSEDQPLKVYAEYYNTSYELQKEANIQFKYTDSLGNEYIKWLNQVDNNYEINLFNLKKGNYNYIVSSNHLQEKFMKKGTFSVISSKREAFNTVANKNSLKTISSNNQLYQLSEIRDLLNILKLSGNKKIKTHKEEISKGLINYKWVLIILVFFPFLEWLIRKNNGLI